VAVEKQRAGQIIDRLLPLEGTWPIPNLPVIHRMEYIRLYFI
jgi:hypothetical protein